ncbi:ATP-binding cassette domain-containing protein [bacterium]|nr:ATP-binding cassette domain-containing protein [bacterium]
MTDLMLSVKNIYKSFGSSAVLSGIDLEFKRGERVALIGPSASGKSVFLKILARVYQAELGEINYEAGVRFGFLFQEGALFDSQTVLENVAFPLFENNPELTRNEVYDRAFDALKKVGVAKAYAKYPSQISGGMQRRVGIARAIVAAPDVLLLDDPTGGLDPVTASVIMELIATLHSQYNPLVIMVSHDLRRLLPRSERLIGLFAGKVIYDGQFDGEALSHAPSALTHFISQRYDLNPSDRKSDNHATQP